MYEMLQMTTWRVPASILPEVVSFSINYKNFKQFFFLFAFATNSSVLARLDDEVGFLEPSWIVKRLSITVEETLQLEDVSQHANNADHQRQVEQPTSTHQLRLRDQRMSGRADACVEVENQEPSNLRHHSKNEAERDTDPATHTRADGFRLASSILGRSTLKNFLGNTHGEKELRCRQESVDEDIQMMDLEPTPDCQGGSIDSL